jgi:protein-S-isoprenylcysteine O-methyltransferase Ste14
MVDQTGILVLRILSLTFWVFSTFLLSEAPIEFSNIDCLLLSVQVALLIAFWLNIRFVANVFPIIHTVYTPTILIDKGPYKFIRHPYYTIYLTCYLSLSLYLNNAFLWLLYTLLVVHYVSAAKDEEHQFLLSPLGEKYEKYIKKTGLFFPFC